MRKNTGNIYKNMIEYIYNLKKGYKYMITVNKEQLFSALKDNWNNPCPMCGYNEWTVSEEMYTPIIIDRNGAMNIGSKILPLIPVTCNYCGNTILVNGKIIGCVEETNDVKDENENV